VNRDPFRFRAALRGATSQSRGSVDVVLRVERTPDIDRLLARLGDRFSVLMIESPEPAVEAAAPEPQTV